MGATHHGRVPKAGRKRRSRAEEKAPAGDLDPLLPMLSIILRTKAGREGWPIEEASVFGRQTGRSSEQIAKAEESKTTSDNRLGIQAADLTAEQRKELELDGGVLVERVGEGAAGDAGIREGDIIVRVDNQLVNNVDELEKLIDKLPEGKSVAVLVQRRGGPIFLAMKVPVSK